MKPTSGSSWLIVAGRRQFLLAVGAMAVGLPARAQRLAQSPVAIGVLHGATRADAKDELAILVRGLREAGFREGENLRIEYRFADYDYDKLERLAKDLVGAKVRVIFAPTTSTVAAAQVASRSIPIVFSAVNDPVGRGLVASLGRPGGNTTGISIADTRLTGKRVQLMKELFPGQGRMGFIYDRDAAAECGIELKDVGAAGRQLRVDVKLMPYGKKSELGDAFGTARRDGMASLLVPTTYETRRFGADLTQLSMASRIPLVHSDSAAVEAGGLMSYGPSREWATTRAAYYIARILGGTKPADLPVEQPAQYELVINLKTAREMGIEIPQAILMRADRVIR